jgi:hypothetical protein
MMYWAGYLQIAFACALGTLFGYWLHPEEFVWGEAARISLLIISSYSLTIITLTGGMRFVNWSRKRASVGRLYDEGVRDPENICELFSANGDRDEDCAGDGHALCLECDHYIHEVVVGSQEGSNSKLPAVNSQDPPLRSEIGRGLFKEGALIECAFSELEVRVLAEAQENLRQGGDNRTVKLRERSPQEITPGDQTPRKKYRWERRKEEEPKAVDFYSWCILCGKHIPSGEVRYIRGAKTAHQKCVEELYEALESRV